MTKTGSGRRPAYRFATVAVLVVLSAALTSCDLARPKGPAPLRYRDAVFSTVTKRADITYGSAVNQDGTRRPCCSTCTPPPATGGPAGR